ncbi:metallophosphoesterase [Allobaculum stercoricanis]|uniref:metallophosphoesterase n=1 Tax=Allobaculum stercoricanis TaxID=174709 RepID=UPI00035C1CB7|nr:metallophosphoesterase [Allobaculum stercoricanis]
MRMSFFSKLLVTIAGCLTTMMLLTNVAMYRAFFHNPNQITTRYEQITSSAIPDSMDQVSIVFLSDIEYDPASFSDQKANDLFEQVKKLNPDVLLLGGDLFSSTADLSDSVRSRMVNWLSSIAAPLGKFAVYGEQDLVFENHRLIVEDVLRQSQVELLNNSSVVLSNNSLQGVRLGGFNVNADPNALLNAFQPDQFCILLSHYPDHFITASQSGLSVDYALAGHAHGTQINWPIYGGYQQMDGASRIDQNHRLSLNFPYEISNGIGCVNVNARLNSPCEILYLTLNQG